MDTGYTRIVDVKLPDDSVVLVRATEIDGGGAEKTGFRRSYDFDGIAKTLKSLSSVLHGSFQASRPDEVTVQLGLELVMKTGALTCLVVEGSGQASLVVTMKWTRGTDTQIAIDDATTSVDLT